ncbi:MAG: flavin reductase [Thermofilum sp. ex4484_15]|nr:MAG: flavin reductase [Thermofilum sp. ex4484_15]
MFRQVLGRFYLTLHPRPAYVIGSGSYGSKANFMAASWVTPVAEEPPRLAVAIDKESLTWELIRGYKEFTVNVLDGTYLSKIYYVGSRSGREVDKVSGLGLKVSRGEKVSSPIISEALAILECKLFNYLECGDTVLIVGDVVRCVAKEEVFEERRGWDLGRVRIPLHIWGRAFSFPSGIKYAKLS